MTKKLKLIRQINATNGDMLYWSEYDGVKVTPFTIDKKRAIKEFNEFRPEDNTRNVIEEKDI
jgi:hypothetical protein